ncbi:MAG: chorismate synthase [Clostridia bacterium]
MQEEKLTIEGRHDPCIVVRALPVIESVAAIAIYELLDKD